MDRYKCTEGFRSFSSRICAISSVLIVGDDWRSESETSLRFGSRVSMGGKDDALSLESEVEADECRRARSTDMLWEGNSSCSAFRMCSWWYFEPQLQCRVFACSTSGFASTSLLKDAKKAHK